MFNSKYITLFFLVLIGIKETQGQPLNGDIEIHLNNIISNLPGSSGEDFNPPSNNELESWEMMMQSIVINDMKQAALIAGDFNYELIPFEDSTQGNRLYHIFQEREPQIKFWGTYVFNSEACRNNLVLQSVHPRYDTNTGFESTFCFKRLSAYALFISGTHRCNHPSASSCSGTTSACGGSSQSFRLSDLPHNVSNVLQKSTEVLANHYPNSVFVQLHGFSKNESDPYVIMSNGSRVTPFNDYISSIRDELKIVDNSLTFKIGHLDLNWSRLLGFTNTQGRLINESSNPCSQNATNSVGRFIHIEQEKSKLREDSTGWHKMYTALAETFECEIISSIETNNTDNYKVFPNPATDRLFVEGALFQFVRIYNMQGTLMQIENFGNTNNATIDISTIKDSQIIVVIQTQSGHMRPYIMIKK